MLQQQQRERTAEKEDDGADFLIYTVCLLLDVQTYYVEQQQRQTP